MQSSKIDWTCNNVVAAVVVVVVVAVVVVVVVIVVVRLYSPIIVKAIISPNRVS